MENNLMIEEFKQAGSEYTFFHDLALKYLKFYASSIGVVTTAFLGISYHFSSLDITKATSIGRFLVGPFLTLCGWFIIIIGVITAFTLIKCRDKCIDSIKSMMRVRQFFYHNEDDKIDIKKYSYYANAIPRYYQLRSTTQGILIVISFINAIAFTTACKGGIEKVFPPHHFLLFNFIPIAINLIPILSLTFLQYIVIFRYVMKKDIVKVNLSFKSKNDIEKVIIKYSVPRAITNNDAAHAIARMFYWFVGLPERNNILFLKREKSREIPIEKNKFEKEIIAGYYQIIAPGYKWKSFVIFSNFYRIYKENGEKEENEVELEKGDIQEYGEAKKRYIEVKNILKWWDDSQKRCFYMGTRYLAYILIFYLLSLIEGFSFFIIFVAIPVFIKLLIDGYKRKYIYFSKSNKNSFQLIF